MKRLSIPGLLCLAVTTLSVAAADFSGRAELKLEGAVAQFSKGQMGKPVHLDVYAECDRRQWHDVWAESDEFNRAMHLGQITEAAATPEGLRLKARLMLGSDNWIKGGPANFDLVLKRESNSEAVTGTFTGIFESPGGPFASQGKVTGRWLPPTAIMTGFEPLKLSEHPRLLIRKSQIPALREKAKTPFGKGLLELLEKSNDPVALGLLYQLTGDRSYAERAMPETVKVMNNRDGGPFALGRFWGYRTSVVGAAYDLCYDAWPSSFREHVENYLDWIIYKCLWRQHRVGTVNWDPGSNYTIVIHAGNGMAALALWGEPGPAPVEPLAPRSEAPRIAAPADFKPAAGMPIVKLDVGQFPTEWLWIGPFEQHVLQHEHPFYDYKQPVDCLAAMGGMENARPTAGQKVTFKNQTLEWKPLTKAANPNIFEGVNQHAGKTIIKSHLLATNRENTHLFYYTVLENERPGWFQFDGNFYEGKCFLAGQRILHGEHFYLEKGRFPLLVPSVMADGEFSCFFQFNESTEETARAFYSDPARQAAYEKAKQQYAEQLALWKANNGANVQWLDAAERLRHWNYLNLRHGMGEGGFQGEGEGYTLECHHVIHDYACAYQSMFGRGVTGLNDIGYFAPRYIATGVWLPGEGGGRERLVSQSFGGHGGGTISARYLGRSMALCPKEWQPVLLWHWLKQLGATAEEIQTEAGARKAFSGNEFHEGLALAEVFINYPLQVKPVAPDGILPNVWEAKTRGFYSFRNNWKGPESIVAQAYAKAGKSCGWSQAEAGGFQIYGLGHAWAWKDNDAVGKEGSRWLDNVVMLPEDPVDAWAHGQVTFFDGDPKSGSGVVSFDLENVYRCVRQVGEGKSARQERFDGGIHGIRSLAVDYSGKSGVQGLFAVADKITGGKKKIWMWQLPRAGRDGPDYQLDIQGNSFTLAYKDASLKATFVSPKTVKIAPVKGGMKANRLSGISEADVNAIHATGEDPATGDFFVVMTLQKTTAPEVKVDGDKATVGGRIVAFDGKKLVLK